VFTVIIGQRKTQACITSFRRVTSHVKADSRFTVICSTFGGNLVIPFSACEKPIWSAMVTPVEAHAGKKIIDWIKSFSTYLWRLGKRIATLEEP
jgi:hypothetical protein